jgi:hypothetical protein
VVLTLEINDFINNMYTGGAGLVFCFLKIYQSFRQKASPAPLTPVPDKYHNVKLGTENTKEYTGKYDINYEELFESKKQPYRKSQIKSWSYYNHTPGSHIDGDASKELQTRSIDALITASKAHKLNLRDTAHVLAIAGWESGFKPYAAAGTTSAAGLGQFINKTGIKYGLNDKTRWDIDAQAHALVKHFKDNQLRVKNKDLSEAYIYKFHHDGEYSALHKGEGLGISMKHIYPKIEPYSKLIKNTF